MNATASSTRAPGYVYAIDLAKNVFQVHTFDVHGTCVREQRLSRSKFTQMFTSPHTPRGVVVMEACGSSNYWARRFAELGYTIRLVPAQFVAKRRMGNKNDGNDANAIFVVYMDKRVKPVPVKTLAQQDLLAAHRLRDRLVKQRTQCRNQIRGLLAERGLVEKAGEAGLDRLLRRLNQDDAAQVTEPLRYLIATVVEQIDQLQTHIACIERHLKTAFKASTTSQLVGSVFGVGLLTATACAGEYGDDVSRFSDGRQFAASIGITPSEHSSGDKRRHGAITKRGNPYLRWLLVQGANAVVNQRDHREDALCLLARRLFAANKRRNTVIVAIANRMARIIYAVIAHREPYRAAGSAGQNIIDQAA